MNGTISIPTPCWGSLLLFRIEAHPGVNALLLLLVLSVLSRSGRNVIQFEYAL